MSRGDRRYILDRLEHQARCDQREAGSANGAHSPNPGYLDDIFVLLTLVICIMKSGIPMGSYNVGYLPERSDEDISISA